MFGLANLILGMCDKYAFKHCSDYTCLTVASHIFIVYNLFLLIEARKTCIFVNNEYYYLCQLQTLVVAVLQHMLYCVFIHLIAAALNCESQATVGIRSFNICVRGAIFSSIRSQDIWYSNTNTTAIITEKQDVGGCSRGPGYVILSWRNIF